MNPYFQFIREDRPAFIPSWRYRLCHYLAEKALAVYRWMVKQDIP